MVCSHGSVLSKQVSRDIFDASRIGEYGCFDKIYVDETQEQQNCCLIISEEYSGPKKLKYLLPNVLMKPSILKAQLSEWILQFIAAAVVKSMSEKEERSGNIFVFGLGVPEHDDDVDRVEQTLEVTCCYRIGQCKSGTVRPIKLSVQGPSTVYQILRSARLLKDIEDFKNIYLCTDRSIEERTNRYKLVAQIKKHRLADLNKRYCIRKGEITVV